MSICKVFALALVINIVFLGVSAQKVNNFAEWKSLHGKAYVDSTQEMYRSYVYNKNVQQINLHNSDPKRTYDQGANQYSDLTMEQFSSTILTLLPSPDQDPIVRNQLRGEQDDPIVRVTAVDHSVANETTNPYPPPVIDQGSCGSCYAFATLTEMAFATSMQKKVEVIYSPQQIVDCTVSFGNYGCDGGFFHTVYNYLKAVNVAKESNYTYIGTQRLCNRFIQKAGPYRVRSYAKTTGGSCTKLRNRVSKSPVSAALAADSAGFMNYKSGILTQASCPATTMNHAVLIVGYDTKSNWKVQNSWGTNWGAGGFITLAAGNTCNICGNGGYYSTLA